MLDDGVRGERHRGERGQAAARQFAGRCRARPAARRRGRARRRVSRPRVVGVEDARGEQDGHRGGDLPRAAGTEGEQVGQRGARGTRRRPEHGDGREGHGEVQDAHHDEGDGRRARQVAARAAELGGQMRDGLPTRRSSTPAVRRRRRPTLQPCGANGCRLRPTRVRQRDDDGGDHEHEQETGQHQLQARARLDTGRVGRGHAAEQGRAGDDHRRAAAAEGVRDVVTCEQGGGRRADGYREPEAPADQRGRARHRRPGGRSSRRRPRPGSGHRVRRRSRRAGPTARPARARRSARPGPRRARPGRAARSRRCRGPPRRRARCPAAGPSRPRDWRRSDHGCRRLPTGYDNAIRRARLS